MCRTKLVSEGYSAPCPYNTVPSESGGQALKVDTSLASFTARGLLNLSILKHRRYDEARVFSPNCHHDLMEFLILIAVYTVRSSRAEISGGVQFLTNAPDKTDSNCINRVSWSHQWIQVKKREGEIKSPW